MLEVSTAATTVSSVCVSRLRVAVPSVWFESALLGCFVERLVDLVERVGFSRALASVCLAL